MTTKRQCYRAYLKSAAWEVKRRRVIFRDGGQCQGVVNGRRCGVRWRLEVHHKTYERFGRERLSDLMTLCQDCHKAVHAHANEFSVAALRKQDGGRRRMLQDDPAPECAGGIAS